MKETMTETTGEATIEIDAGPEAVWDILADLSKIKELSPECYKAEWEGDATGPAVGAQFRGYNESGGNSWDAACVVTAADRGVEWAFEVPAQDGTATVWHYVITPTDSGCAVTESFDSPLLATDYFLAMRPPRVGVLRNNIQQTLANLKTVAEA